MNNPLSPPSDPVQRRLQSPPAKSNFLAVTEFGRTPIVNRNIGRDHYPQAFTSVLAGGGFKGGYVYGKTSEGAEEVVEKPITIPDFNATIAYALGIPTDLVLNSPSKRPFSVAHKGQPVLDLFA